MPPAPAEQARDPLLRITRLLLILSLAIATLAGVAALLAIPAVWLVGDRLAFDGVPASAQARSAITAGLACGMVICVMAVLFMRNLVAIVDSVGQGSPFIADNARRLRTMGWLVLGLQGLMMIAAPVSLWIKEVVPGARIVLTFDFGWLLTALLLFVLARVFDTGTRLAEDVEGTV